MFFKLDSLVLELSKSHQSLSRTKQLHALVTKSHLLRDPFYATKITRLYALNNDLSSARNLFDKTPQRSVFLWNSIIRAYAKANQLNDAISLFKNMLRTEIRPDNFTYACIIRACSESFDLEGLRLVHGMVVSGLGLDSVTSSALVTAYSNLSLIDDASKVFIEVSDPDLILCNSMISGYEYCGFWDKSLQLWNWMRRVGKKPDGYTLVGLISGLRESRLLRIGQGIHGFCLKSGFDSSDHVVSVLVSMYARCKCMNSAYSVFSSLFQPDLVTWSALITGYSQYGDYEKALYYFRKMHIEGKKADPVLIASVLVAAAQSTNVWSGSVVHGYVIQRGFELSVVVSSALTDMYSKCGFVDLGIRVFETMTERNIVTYNTVIRGLALHGFASQAFKMFEEIIAEGLKPDESTFAALLCACCHCGLVNNGLEIFRQMMEDFRIQARTEHYVYIVKLLGTVGNLEEAYNFILSLPKPVDSGIWGALLSCCDVHQNSELAEIGAQLLFKNDPNKGAYRVMLSNIYASNGRWDDVKKLRDLVDGGLRKVPGLSWIVGTSD
ncbi:putative pentatricopeptide repeat-containing protein At1g64310 [Pistacia vera]|uniref:putative pentatricopeptide repeat-containing protein At1g64310 n=1 Tax=Pistacia vera TaxID=55513 RepID=UPI001263A296|nr:putative pentatricopeptide repeat-containing protein At1g64310 [Pistacia vera]